MLRCVEYPFYLKFLQRDFMIDQDLSVGGKVFLEKFMPKQKPFSLVKL